MRKRLRKLKHKISRQRRVIQRIRKGIRSKRSNEAQLVRDLKQAERYAKRKRWRRRWLSNPDHRPHWSEQERDQRREELADQIEELEDLVDELIEAMDKLDRRKTRARRELERRKDRRDRLRKRRRKIAKQLKEKKAEGNRLSKDFVVAEFDCRNGTPVPESAVPALRDLVRDHLQPLRDSGGTVRVNSGYRTRAYNASIGGATGSYHIYDEKPHAPAADHTQDGRSASSVADWHDAHGNPDGMGRYASFTHIDDRGYRSRWWG